jgi:hypothetical protein
VARRVGHAWAANGGCNAVVCVVRERFRKCHRVGRIPSSSTTAPR